MRTVAALFVETNGCYFGLVGVDPWDITRDARTYAGPHPVVAHPPCERWGRYWNGGPSARVKRLKGDDGGCFTSALTAVRRWGGCWSTRRHQPHGLRTACTNRHGTEGGSSQIGKADGPAASSRGHMAIELARQPGSMLAMSICRHCTGDARTATSCVWLKASTASRSADALSRQALASACLRGNVEPPRTPSAICSSRLPAQRSRCRNRRWHVSIR